MTAVDSFLDLQLESVAAAPSPASSDVVASIRQGTTQVPAASLKTPPGSVKLTGCGDAHSGGGDGKLYLRAGLLEHA
jgi:hypothetical protein